MWISYSNKICVPEGEQRRAARTMGHWRFHHHGVYSLAALDQTTMHTGLFDICLLILYIRSANWILVCLFLSVLIYYFCFWKTAVFFQQPNRSRTEKKECDVKISPKESVALAHTLWWTDEIIPYLIIPYLDKRAELEESMQPTFSQALFFFNFICKAQFHNQMPQDLMTARSVPGCPLPWTLHHSEETQNPEWREAQGEHPEL